MVVDIDVVELFVGDVIDVGYYGGEYVFFVVDVFGVFVVFGDDFVDYFVYEGDVVGECFVVFLYLELFEW